LSFKHKIVKNNDVIVLATDGMYDNLFPNQILEILDRNVKKGFCVLDIAKDLARTAFDISLDPKCDTPFAQEARKYGYHYTGGKSDDICVIVSKVKIYN